ncbi:MAG: winged helix-turn-helix domain-containing protein [Gallionella sp.]|nr:winged helix-turn-helix domain-containing protein [Gallionella sp.]MDD4964047.1 winged helix-turn-helix domain-containing protein [Gallionella sp.]
MQLHSAQVLNHPIPYWDRHEDAQPIQSGGLHLLPSVNQLQVGDAQLFLRPMVFRLLHFLMTHPNQVHSRHQLLSEIWGSRVVVEARTVDVHIRCLRASLQPFGLDKLIQTIHCRGYLFSSVSNVVVQKISIN